MAIWPAVTAATSNATPKPAMPATTLFGETKENAEPVKVKAAGT